jgi:dihydroneopterin aldolase
MNKSPTPPLKQYRSTFVRDLELPAKIGVHSYEKIDSQVIRINVDMRSCDDGVALNDDLRNVICYEDVIIGITDIIAAGHINLVETLAEKIAEYCLSDHRVVSVKVRVEKPHIVAEAESVGVEIERYQLLPGVPEDAG